MTTTAASVSPPALHPADREVSTARLWVLRATYALLVIGLGLTNLPELIAHAPTSRGVIPSLLGGIWLLALVGLRHPLRMLPLLLFEFAWKTIWFLGYGLPQWLAGQAPPTFDEDFFAIALGVVLMPIVLPWGYVWRRYFSEVSRVLSLYLDRSGKLVGIPLPEVRPFYPGEARLF